MNINDLTVAQVKELMALFPELAKSDTPAKAHPMLGKKVIIRTYSAGNWYGTLAEKDGNEVILADARRMWRWWAAESISLSAVSLYGIKHDESKIVAPVESVWLEAIEIIPCTEQAMESIESAPHAKAE